MDTKNSIPIADTTSSLPPENAVQPKSIFSDLSKVRLPQNYSDYVDLKKEIVTIPVKKPGKQQFFRTHPSPQYRLECALLPSEEGKDTYFVLPSIAQEISSLVSLKLLVLAIDTNANIFLWPIGLPNSEGFTCEYHKSAASIAVIAETYWVRLQTNLLLKTYEAIVAETCSKTPNWPDLQMERILEIAFDGKIIDSLNHPVIRRLQGEL